MPKTQGLQYDATWFMIHEPTWSEKLRPWLEKTFKQDKSLRLLEIGSYEGLSSSWLLENLLDIAKDALPGAVHLTCVDAWPGPEYKPLRDKCLHNLRTVSAAFGVTPDACYRVYEAPSEEVLPTLPGQFHFIYVDGCHKADAVYKDTIEAFRLVRPGGMIFWDDYCCATTPKEEKDQVTAGVNRAFAELGIKHEDVIEWGHDLVYRKKG
jgi:predicted O-methyltransferase YrrM